MMKSEDGDEDLPYPLCEDIGDLITDDNDSNQFDDANWMHKIDVTQFKGIQQDISTFQVNSYCINIISSFQMILLAERFYVFLVETKIF